MHIYDPHPLTFKLPLPLVFISPPCIFKIFFIEEEFEQFFVLLRDRSQLTSTTDGVCVCVCVGGGGGSTKRLKMVDKGGGGGGGG